MDDLERKAARNDARSRAADEIERWERQVEDELVRLFDRQEHVVLARLGGVKARKDTRHWFPPGEKKIDANYVLDPRRWIGDAVDAVRGIFGRLYDSAARAITRKLIGSDGIEITLSEGPLADTMTQRLNFVAKGVQAVHDKVHATIVQAEDSGAPLEEVEAKVRTLYADKGKWAKLIASNNVTAALNEGSLHGAELAGAVAKQWLSSRDEKVRDTHEHADGQVVAIDQHFRLGGIPTQPIVSWLLFPHDPTGPPHEVMNCRCTMLFSLTVKTPDGEMHKLTDLPDLWAAQQEEKGVYGAGYGFEGIHHSGQPKKVRTVAGEHFYGEPIGAPIRPNVKHRHIPELGSLKPDAKGLDTPSTAFGMKFHTRNASHPAVVAARQWKGWGDLPTIDFPLGAGKIKLNATEERLKSGPIKKVVSGEPFRKGYDPELVVTDDGVFVADGHHRVAMHYTLEHDTMPSKVLDMRGVKTEADARKRLAQIDKQLADARAKAEADKEAKLVSDADDLAQKMTARAHEVEPKITPVILSAVHAAGGYMDGLNEDVKNPAELDTPEKQVAAKDFRFKLPKSTARKIVTKAHRKHASASVGASSVNDTLRYTAVMPTDDYTDGVKHILDGLAKQGFHPTVTNNYWSTGDAYSGLNMIMGGKGFSFEIQFHTPESMAAKMENHADYEISRDEKAPLEERIAAWERQIPSWDKVPRPKDWTDFGNIFIYDQPGTGSRGRYIDKYQALGIPKPKPVKVADDTMFDIEDEPAKPKHWWKLQWGADYMPWHKKGPEHKALHVRTAAGARHFGQPVGSLVVPGEDAVHHFVASTGDTYDLRYGQWDAGEAKPRHRISAFHDGTKVGELDWYGTTGVIHNIDVEPEHGRRGLATAMWEWAQTMRRPPKHSRDRTVAGEAWARSVGGTLPHRSRD